MEHFNKKQHKDIKGIATDTRDLLLTHDFPGNIRELQNIIEHAFILCTEGNILPEHLPEYLQQREKIQTGDADTRLVQVESQTILETLKRHNWNKAAAARELGIHKSTLWRKMKALNIVPSAGRAPLN